MSRATKIKAIVTRRVMLACAQQLSSYTYGDVLALRDAITLALQGTDAAAFSVWFNERFLPRGQRMTPLAAEAVAHLEDMLIEQVTPTESVFIGW